jgi:hypothetical protein
MSTRSTTGRRFSRTNKFASSICNPAIARPTDLDLKNGLDEIAALCAALDLVISAPVAAGALAGAVGTEVWLLTAGRVWPALGTDRFPWFAKSRVLSPKRYANWPELMTRLARELDTFVQSRQRGA